MKFSRGFQKNVASALRSSANKLERARVQPRKVIAHVSKYLKYVHEDTKALVGGHGKWRKTHNNDSYNRVRHRLAAVFGVWAGGSAMIWAMKERKDTGIVGDALWGLLVGAVGYGGAFLAQYTLPIYLGFYLNEKSKELKKIKFRD